MEGLSEHTVLVNGMIGLCTKTRGWPSTLKDLGYKIEYLEPTFLNSEGKKVNPDILFTSNKLIHALITECKGGVSIEDEQLEKYSKINVENVRNWVRVYDASKLSLDLCLASYEESSEKILENIDSEYNFPILVFSLSNFISKINKFSNSKLDQAFSTPIEISYPPTEFYPFDDEDDVSLIALYVLRELAFLALNNLHNESVEFEPDEMLERIHPMWANIHETKKKKLRSKTKEILDEYKKEQLSEHLAKVKGKNTWQITKSMKAFGDKCNKIIKELTEQKKISIYEE